MEIELVRGTRRRKHVEAVLVGDRLRVSFPYWMSLAEASQTAEELAERMRRRIAPGSIDVAARARRLAREHGLPRARSVRWVDNMRQRWGSCTPEDGTIRVSARLASERGARFVVVGGAPFPEARHLWWNFASSSEVRIDEAKRDWLDRRGDPEGPFPLVPGDTQEFIPIPE